MLNFQSIYRQLFTNIMSKRSLFVQNARSLERIKTQGIDRDHYKNGKYLVLGNDSVLLNSASKSIIWVTEDELPKKIIENDQNKVILDVDKQEPEVCLFAVSINDEDTSEILKPGCKFYNSRTALFLLNSRESSLASKARGLINFCNKTNYCTACGSKLETKAVGTHKICTKCQKVHYPTLCPVGIVIIDDESHSKVLLVRGARHPPGMYSCVAGFFEPGESLEENVRREIAEEVGIDVVNIEYCASQHWAMPDSQLMLGCVATATTTDFQLDPIELSGGQWVDAKDLADAVKRAKSSIGVSNTEVLWVPPQNAVAHNLMEFWLRKYHSFTTDTSSRL